MFLEQTLKRKEFFLIFSASRSDQVSPFGLETKYWGMVLRYRLNFDTRVWQYFDF